jgi:hypothetical protein
MPTEASILSSSLVQKQFKYFVEKRPHIFETIHFTVDKPWRATTGPSHPFLCSMLKEFAVSMIGCEKYNMTAMSSEYLRNCK